MQPLRGFCIIAFVFIITANSSNISNIPFESDNDADTRASVIDSRSFFLSVEGKVSFSSLLQPIDAQEQEESEVEQLQEVEGELVEEQPAEEQPAEEQPAEEQPAEEQPAEEQPAEEQPAEEQPAEEADETPPPAAIDKNENNLTSFSGVHRNLTNVSALEDKLSLKCDPSEVEIKPGEDASINCTVENKTSDPIEIVMECSGLEGTGIKCYINGENPIGRTLTEMSDTNFSIVLVSRPSPPVTAGSYPFMISVDECINSNLC
jgi:hypothetical protein